MTLAEVLLLAPLALASVLASTRLRQAAAATGPRSGQSLAPTRIRTEVGG